MPTGDEMETDLTWDEIANLKNKYQFSGDYHCKLCPKRVLNTKQDLKEHLVSKVCAILTNDVAYRII